MILSVVSLLTACGHKNVLWHPPEGTAGRQYNQDRLVCRGVADYPASAVPGGGLGGLLMNAGAAQEAQTSYINCMMAAGYTPEYR
jgi:predicted small lipoprotein YifL